MLELALAYTTGVVTGAAAITTGLAWRIVRAAQRRPDHQ